MIYETDIIPEYLINLMTLTYPPKHTGQFFKCFWILKKLIVPPLFYENRFVTDFKKNAELFNSFFAKHCTIINNDNNLPSKLLLKTEILWGSILRNLV